MGGWLLPLIGLFGSCVVAAANYGVQRWRYTIDQTATATERVCLVVDAAANCATRYWQLDAQQDANKQTVMQLEAELLGFQLRVQQGIVGLTFQDERLQLAHIDASTSDLFDRLTGGDFQVIGRSPDYPRSRDVQAQAALLCAILRRALFARAKLWR